MKDYGNAFQDTFGYDPARARIEFGWGRGSPAYTIGDTIVVDRSWWSANNGTTSQGGALVHELTHCVQFSQGGVAGVMTRRAVETVTHGPQGQYDVTPELGKMTNLKALNVLDNRFTIESIAVHVEEQMTLYRAGTGARR